VLVLAHHGDHAGAVDADGHGRVAEQKQLRDRPHHGIPAHSASPDGTDADSASSAATWPSACANTSASCAPEMP